MTQLEDALKCHSTYSSILQVAGRSCRCVAATLRDEPHSYLLGIHHFCVYPSDIFELQVPSTCLCAFSGVCCPCDLCWGVNTSLPTNEAALNSWCVNTPTPSHSVEITLRSVLYYLSEVPNGIEPQLPTVVTCSVIAPYRLPFLPATLLYATLLYFPARASWGHLPPPKYTTCIIFLSQGQLLGEPNLGHVSTHGSPRIHDRIIYSQADLF